jgi:fatty acid desaturase
MSIFAIMMFTALTFGVTSTFATSKHHTFGVAKVIQLMSDDFFRNSHTHHHIQAMSNNDNPTGSLSPTQYGYAQYGWSHPQHDRSLTDKIANNNDDNSNIAAGTTYSGSFSPTQYGYAQYRWSHPHHHQNEINPYRLEDTMF